MARIDFSKIKLGEITRTPKAGLVNPLTPKQSRKINFNAISLPTTFPRLAGAPKWNPQVDEKFTQLENAQTGQHLTEYNPLLSRPATPLETTLAKSKVGSSLLGWFNKSVQPLLAALPKTETGAPISITGINPSPRTGGLYKATAKTMDYSNRLIQTLTATAGRVLEGTGFEWTKSTVQMESQLLQDDLQQIWGHDWAAPEEVMGQTLQTLAGSAGLAAQIYMVAHAVQGEVNIAQFNRAIQNTQHSQEFVAREAMGLGFNEQFTQEQLRDIYRSLVNKYHPDLHPDNPLYTIRMGQINAAYKFLRNEIPVTPITPLTMEQLATTSQVGIAMPASLPQTPRPTGVEVAAQDFSFPAIWHSADTDFPVTVTEILHDGVQIWAHVIAPGSDTYVPMTQIVPTAVLEKTAVSSGISAPSVVASVATQPKAIAAPSSVVSKFNGPKPTGNFLTFVHYSGEPGLKTISASFMGTGKPGEEIGTQVEGKNQDGTLKMYPGNLPKIAVYGVNTKPEVQFLHGYVYQVKVDEGTLYHATYGEKIPSDVELQNAGWKGIVFKSDSPYINGQARLFGDVPATFVGKVGNETAIDVRSYTAGQALIEASHDNVDFTTMTPAQAGRAAENGKYALVSITTKPKGENPTPAEIKANQEAIDERRIEARRAGFIKCKAEFDGPEETYVVPHNKWKYYARKWKQMSAAVVENGEMNVIRTDDNSVDMHFPHMIVDPNATSYYTDIPTREGYIRTVWIPDEGQDESTITVGAAEINNAPAEIPQAPSRAFIKDYKETAEYVPIEELAKYAEFDRAKAPIRDEATLQEIQNDILLNGFTSPLILDYNPDTGYARLIEGNHRLVIAQNLGLKDVPVRVVRGNLLEPEEGHGGAYARPYKGEGWFPSDASPSMAGLPITATVSDTNNIIAALSEIKNEPGTRLTFDANGNLVKLMPHNPDETTATGLAFFGEKITPEEKALLNQELLDELPILAKMSPDEILRWAGMTDEEIATLTPKKREGFSKRIVIAYGDAIRKWGKNAVDVAVTLSKPFTEWGDEEYPAIREYAASVLGEENVDLVINLLAALSAHSSVAANITNTEKALSIILEKHRLPTPEDKFENGAGLADWQCENIRKMIASPQSLPKLGEFRGAIAGNSESLVMDVWMIRFWFGTKPDGKDWPVTPERRVIAKALTASAALKAGREYRAMQASIWAYTRELYHQKAEGSYIKIGQRKVHKDAVSQLQEGLAKRRASNQYPLTNERGEILSYITSGKSSGVTQGTPKVKAAKINPDETIVTGLDFHSGPLGNLLPDEKNTGDKRLIYDESTGQYYIVEKIDPDIVTAITGPYSGKKNKNGEPDFKFTVNTTGQPPETISAVTKFKDMRNAVVRFFGNTFDGLMVSPMGAEYMAVAVAPEQVYMDMAIKPFYIDKSGRQVFVGGEFAPTILNNALNKYGEPFAKFVLTVQRANVPIDNLLGLPQDKLELAQKDIQQRQADIAAFAKSSPQTYQEYMDVIERIAIANSLILPELYRDFISPARYNEFKENPHYIVPLSVGESDTFEPATVAPLTAAHGLSHLEQVIDPSVGLRMVYMDALRSWAINNAKIEAIRFYGGKLATTAISNGLVSVHQAGETFTYDVPDRNVRESVKNLSRPKDHIPKLIDLSLKAQAIALRTFATGVNWAFSPFNVLRDATQTAGLVPVTPRAVGKGLKRAVLHPGLSQYFDSYRSPTMSVRQKGLKVIETVFKIMSYPMEVGESATRSIVAESVLTKGGTYLDQYHAYLASSGFFALHGTLFRDWIANCIPFVRATIGVIRAWYRDTFYGLPITGAAGGQNIVTTDAGGRIVVVNKQSGRVGGTFSWEQGAEKISGRILSVVAMSIISLLAIASSGKQKEYKLLKNRAEYWYFPLPNGTWIKLPVPIGFAAVHAATDYVAGYETDFYDVIRQSADFLPQLDSMMMLPEVSTSLQLKLNINFYTGGPIWTKDDTPAKNALEAAIMKSTGLKEEQAAFLIRSFVADIPSQVQYVMDMVTHGKSTQAFPLTKRFIVQDPTKSSNAAIDDFYELVNASDASGNAALQQLVNKQKTYIGSLLHNAKIDPENAKTWYSMATDSIIMTFEQIAHDPENYNLRKVGSYSFRPETNYELLNP